MNSCTKVIIIGTRIFFGLNLLMASTSEALAYMKLVALVIPFISKFSDDYFWKACIKDSSGNPFRRKRLE